MQGNLLIYRIEDADMGREPKLLYLPRGLPTSDQLEVVVRIYVIRGINLHPEDPNGKSDPYLIARLGDSHEFNDRQHYVPMQLNPIFGKCVQFLNI